MKAERSRKSDLLKSWGIRALGRGVPWAEVTQTMARMRRKTLSEIEAFVREATE